MRAGRSPRGREVELTFHKVTKSGRNGYKTMTMLCLKKEECGKKECGTRTYVNDKKKAMILHLWSSIGSICRLTVLYRSNQERHGAFLLVERPRS